MRPELSHSEWPVPMMTNARKNPWVTLKSTQNALSLNCFLWHTHAKTPAPKLRRGPQTLLQARHLCQASWQISEARTYWKYALAHMWQQHNVHRASTWFRAEPKKHGWSKHSWLLLTESRNSINAQGDQPFTFSLSIYSCSMVWSFEWNRPLLSWLTSFTRTWERRNVVFSDGTVVRTTVWTCCLLKYRLARRNRASRGQSSHQMGRWSGYNMPAHFVLSAVGTAVLLSIDQHSFCSARTHTHKKQKKQKNVPITQMDSTHEAFFLVFFDHMEVFIIKVCTSTPTVSFLRCFFFRFVVSPDDEHIPWFI